MEKDSDGNVIDAFIIESTTHYGGAFIKTKIPEKAIDGPDGSIKIYSYASLYLYSHINNKYKEGLTEGTLKLVRISEYYYWKTLNIDRTLNYAFLRFINIDSKGNAILNYKAWYPEVPR